MNDRQRLEAIISVVCKYLPPGGISKDQALNEIISLIDPLPVQEPVMFNGLTESETNAAASVAGLTKHVQPVQEPVAWVDLLRQAEEIVRSKPLWKKYIDGTPLANDIAVWMADFAQEHSTPSAQEFVCSTGLCHYKAQRPWVGLTPEEENALVPDPDGSAEANVRRVEVLPGAWGKEYEEVDAWSKPLVLQMLRDHEAALKDKNNG